MEPNDELQLRNVLREWQAPAVPRSLEQRVLKSRVSWPGYLLHGHLRVPLPVVYCLIALLMFAGWRISARSASTSPCVADCNRALTGAC